MPPAAATFIEYSSSLQPFDEVGGIEVEAIEGNDAISAVTRVMMVPRDRKEDDFWSRSTSKLTSSSSRAGDGMYLDDPRYNFLSRSGDKSLADSFDSLDEIDENSNEARLIKSIAEKAAASSAVGEPSTDPRDAYFLNEAEAQYLDVLDRHLEDTDPETMSFSGLDSGPDDPHPKKNRGNADLIMEHLLDAPCCECSGLSPRPLKSALRPSRWTYSGASQATSASGNHGRSRSVKFKDVDVRQFNMTLGNHPSATSGPPVMLDWDSKFEPKVMDLETYENGRQPRRNRRQLKLSLQQRHIILVKERGFSFEEVKGAWQEALNVRKQRKETLERGLGLMKWDEVWESTCRKFARIVDGSV